MTISDRFWTFLFALALASSPALAHDAEVVMVPGPFDSELGTPGNASDVAATITVAMEEMQDGRMAFMPPVIVTRPGTTLRLVLVNHGGSDHEFVLGTDEELANHAALMRDMPEMAHEEPNALHLKPGVSGEIIWKFGKSDSIGFACLLPGHAEAGMTGKFVLREAEMDDGTTSSVNMRSVKWALRTRRGRM